MSSPHVPSLRKHSANQPGPHFVPKHSLGDYFSTEEEQRAVYTDKELAHIASLLRESDRASWSQVPRIYVVLRLIGQLRHLDAFIDQGLNDFWLPFNGSQLPKKMAAADRNQFIEHQNMVLTKAMSLENTSVRKHTHFSKGEELPLEIGDLLGQGGYGAVHKAYSPLSGRTYALKRFRRMKTNHREVQSFMNELKVLQRISHHHCVELVASYTDQKTFGLLMFPVADCNLSAFYALVTGSEPDNVFTLMSFFGCLASTLQFLHDSKIRHRDIKPENILVRGSEVYLTDFGISLDWENLSRSTTTAESGKSWTYCAPEVAHSKPRNSSSDIWSLGCVFLEMFILLNGSTIEDLRKKMRDASGSARFYENIDMVLEWAETHRPLAGTTQEVLDWIQQMLTIDPAHRITAQALYEAIIKHGTKFQESGGSNSFCGNCCSFDHGLESSSDAASGDDDELWAAGFGENTSPLTTPAVTDGSQRSTERKLNSSSKVALSTSTSSLRLDRLQIAKSRVTEDFAKHRPVNEGSSGQTQNAIHLGASISVPHLPDSKDSFVLDDSWIPKSNSEIRTSIIKEVTDIHPTWPFVDLRNRLPDLTASSWKSPAAFLGDIQSDVLFMEALKVAHAKLHKRIKEAREEDVLPILHLLLLNGLNPNSPTFNKPPTFTPLVNSLCRVYTRSKHHRDIAKLLIGFGAKLNVKPREGHVPLIVACYNQNAVLVRCILELDVSTIDYRNKNNETPLMMAALSGHTRIAELLLKHGADFRLTTYIGRTAGTAAAFRGHFGVVKALVEHGMGADEGRPFLNGDWRPIHGAATCGHVEMTKYLLEHGADPKRRAVGGYFVGKEKTPLNIAKKNGHTKVVKILEQAIAARKQKG